MVIQIFGLTLTKCQTKSNSVRQNFKHFLVEHLVEKLNSLFRSDKPYMYMYNSLAQTVVK